MAATLSLSRRRPFERHRRQQEVGLTATLERLSVRRQLPAALVGGALLPYAATGYLTRKGLRYRRLVQSLSLSTNPLSRVSRDLPEIDVVIPCGPHDVDVVSFAVDGVQQGSTNPIGSIRVVAPGTLLPIITNRLGDRAVVIDEGELIPSAIASRLEELFPTRRNWILQQLIKLASVLHCSARGVLVLDADTVLMHARTWVTSDGRQVLTPSLEWHKPYYALLAGLARNNWPRPHFSFVSHHMLMQPDILRVIMSSIGLNSIDALVDSLGDLASNSTESTFSEYEFYAQGLLALEPQNVALAKWSNLSVRREEAGLRQRFTRYMSISCHHYLV